MARDPGEQVAWELVSQSHASSVFIIAHDRVSQFVNDNITQFQLTQRPIVTAFRSYKARIQGVLRVYRTKKNRVVVTIEFPPKELKKLKKNQVFKNAYIERTDVLDNCCKIHDNYEKYLRQAINIPDSGTLRRPPAATVTDWRDNNFRHIDSSYVNTTESEGCTSTSSSEDTATLRRPLRPSGDDARVKQATLRTIENTLPEKPVENGIVCQVEVYQEHEDEGPSRISVDRQKQLALQLETEGPAVKQKPIHNGTLTRRKPPEDEIEVLESSTSTTLTKKATPSGIYERETTTMKQTTRYTSRSMSLRSDKSKDESPTSPNYKRVASLPFKKNPAPPKESDAISLAETTISTLYNTGTLANPKRNRAGYDRGLFRSRPVSTAVLKSNDGQYVALATGIMSVLEFIPMLKRPLAVYGAISNSKHHVLHDLVIEACVENMNDSKYQTAKQTNPKFILYNGKAIVQEMPAAVIAQLLL